MGIGKWGIVANDQYQPTNVSIPFQEFVFRNIRVKGSLISSKAEAQRMLEIVAEHGIKVRSNAFMGLEEIPKLVELAHGGKMVGKGLIIVDEQEQKKEREKKGKGT